MNLPILYWVKLTIFTLSNFLLLLAQRHLLYNLLLVSRRRVIARRSIALPPVIAVLSFSLLPDRLPGFRVVKAAIRVCPLLLNFRWTFHLVYVVDLLL